MQIHEIKSTTYKKKKKIKGRGIAAGKGKTAGRGTKGQKSRSGGTKGSRFEGGQTPLFLKLPKKRGFKNIFKKNWQIINVSDLAVFDNNSKVTIQDLAKKGLIRKKFSLIKILGDGLLDKKLEVEAHAFSKEAARKIEKSKGKTR